MQKRFCTRALILCTRVLIACSIPLAVLAPVQPARAQQTPSGADSRPDPHEIPLPPVDTGVAPLPGADSLPSRAALPDVLVDAHGKTIHTLTAWQQRRPQVRRILEWYATGQMPPAPGALHAEAVHTEPVLGGKATYRLLRITFSTDGSKDAGKQLQLYAGLWTPAGPGPFPAIIYQGSEPPGGPDLPRSPLGPTQGKGTDVLLVTGGGKAAPPARPAITAEQFAAERADVLGRGYAIAMFNPGDCAEDTTLREADGSWTFRHTRFPGAYTHYDWGVLAAWAWGASRVADALQTMPAIDRKVMLVTGASRWGKSSLIAAAFDDRLMGAPVVTGGGGVGAYRLAGTDGSETLDQMVRKYPNWFSPQLHAFWGQRDKLPFDEHWFLALAAPRPFLALEGDADTISSPPAVEGSIAAARPVYRLYGVSPERLRAHYSHHAHAFTAEDWTAMMDAADAFLRHLPVQPPAEVFPTPAERAAAVEREHSKPRPGAVLPPQSPNPNAGAHVSQ